LQKRYDVSGYRLKKNPTRTGLFCKRAQYKQGSFAKEPYEDRAFLPRSPIKKGCFEKELHENRVLLQKKCACSIKLPTHDLHYKLTCKCTLTKSSLAKEPCFHWALLQKSRVFIGLYLYRTALDYASIQTAFAQKMLARCGILWGLFAPSISSNTDSFVINSSVPAESENFQNK